MKRDNGQPSGSIVSDTGDVDPGEITRKQRSHDRTSYRATLPYSAAPASPQCSTRFKRVPRDR